MKLAIIILTAFMTIGGCGKIALQPDDITIDDIRNSPVDVITGRGWQVAVYDDFLTNHGIQEAIETLEDDADFFADCMGYDRQFINAEIAKHKVVLVPRTFTCLFGQHEVCHGAYSSTFDFIVVAKNRPFSEDYILGRHEFAHMTGDYKTDHSNLTDELLECIEIS